jgi:hypothetical protein
MPLTTHPLPYGLRDVKLTAYTDAAATTLGTSVDLPVGRTFSFSEAEEFTELRGDDKVVATRGQGSTVEFELESGGISLDAWKVLSGGTLTSTGTAPAQSKKLSKKSTDARPYFKVEGQIISDSGGDVHCVLPKCKITDSLEGEFSDGEFMLTNASGTAIGSTLTGQEDVVYEMTQNETAVAIT